MKHIAIDLLCQDIRREKIFTDWYDFADYLKQAKLAGYFVTIYGWRYVTISAVSSRME